MKLVWHHPEMRQKDWIRFLFGDLVTGEVEDPDFTCFDDDTIHVVSMIFQPLRAMEPYFEQLRGRCDNVVLYHAGDEWLSGGCAPYKYFDNVVREMPSYFTRADGVLGVPLGSVALSSRGPYKPASQRRLIWSFAGEIRNTRVELVKYFDAVPYGKVVDTKYDESLTPAEYDEMLRETVFAPCGMGNIITETWRVYEAIEAGAIPLIERRVTLDYYRGLLGEHPIPTFRNWRSAAQFVHTLTNDEVALDSLQRQVAGWWVGYKEKLVRRVADQLSTSHNASLVAFAANPVNANVPIHETLRVVELLRHQSRMNLRRRFANPVAPVRRIVLGLAKKDER